ncbi:50S ribosomal protein L17 [Gemmata sp. G18]|uniref:Large ribosomal subunit protein bL17 n=1 Tax=Gemmata palustris TaxID=2822762 RepID=A0ABS5C3H3_9BACT|nr:50S ribosomal protein L17 [Gemmata palustris]MBP3960035.1 50S ribosomal protein L17 [Gemmata palustris]
MRHRKRGRHLNRTASHRRSLFRNLTRALITHEKIVTTVPKAKELRPIVEKIITLAKKANAVTAAASGKGDAEEKTARVQALHYRRQAMALLGPTHGTGIWDKKDESTGDTVLKKLFREIGPRYADRPGGYTRILKQHYRRLGDASPTAVIELLKAGEKKVQQKAKQPVAPAAPAPVAPEPAPVAPETPAAN